MLTIFKGQISSLEQYMERTFKSYVSQYLRKHYPDESSKLSELEIHKLVDKGILKAKKYEIDDRNSVKQFLEYMLCLGEDFDIKPADKWILHCLNMRGVSGFEKMKELQLQVPLKSNQ
jgi:hypothetical protein